MTAPAEPAALPSWWGDTKPDQLGAKVLATINYTRRVETVSNRASKGELGAGYVVKGTSETSRGTNGMGKSLLDPQEMPIYNVRPVLEKLAIDRHGVVVAPLRSQLPDALEVVLDEKEKDIKRIYYPELEELCKKYVVREDGSRPSFALCTMAQKFTEDKSRGYMGAYSRQAHADLTGPDGPLPPKLFKGARRLLEEKGVSVEKAEKMDLMFLNAWRPFAYNVVDNPLTILDWTSVEPEKDVYIIPKGTPLNFGEPIQRITHNPNHRWLYLPNMTPDEVYLFKQSDSRVGLPSHIAKHAFHTAFRLPEDPGTARTRRSIAVRMILFFEPAQEMSRL